MPEKIDIANFEVQEIIGKIFVQEKKNPPIKICLKMFLGSIGQEF